MLYDLEKIQMMLMKEFTLELPFHSNKNDRKLNNHCWDKLCLIYTKFSSYSA